MINGAIILWAVLILIPLASLSLSIVYISKLKYNFRQTLTAAGISLLIAFGISALLIFLSFFTVKVQCKEGVSCPSGPEVFIHDIFGPLLPLLFFVTLAIYLMIKSRRDTKNKQIEEIKN